MFQLSPKLAAIIAATAAAGFSGAAIAGAADSSSSSSKQRSAGRGAGETALTGETKAKVEAAALARVKGTVLRTETDNGGVYESHIRRSDGTEVEVKVNRAFEVTAVEEMRGRGGRGGHRGPGGPGHRMHADLAAIAQALGVTEAKLRSALEAARPDKPSGRRGDHHAELAAAIAKALGVETADVQAILEDLHDDRGERHRRGPGDESALVAAIADKLSVSREKAQAAVDAARKAHEAEHEAREDAMYAAVAKALGKDAAAVEQAFEANRPPKPAP